MICSVCKETFELLISPVRRYPVKAPNIPHHKKFKSFKSSLEQKCYVCTGVWESLKADERKNWEDEWMKWTWPGHPNSVSVASIAVTPSARLEPQDYTICLRLNLPRGPLGEIAGRIAETFFLLEPPIVQISPRRKRLRKLFSGRTEEPESALTRPVLGLTTASSLDLAKSWVNNCVTHHAQCKIYVNQVTWLPTRLLYFTAGTVQLMETKKTKPTTPYMTLTHRWGFADEEKMMLNRRTYPSLIGGIPISSMPKLFQEVMTVALHLDVNYIWIDALCIFQDKDDQTDWYHEASQMQKVYSNSFCNISAADATSCSDTLFSQSRNLEEEILPQAIQLNLVSIPPLSSSPASSSSSSSSSISTTSISSQTSSHLLSSLMTRLAIPKLTYTPKTTAESFTLIDLSLWTSQVSQALVNTRAWVLQERVLAPRILHFGRRQLFWECRCSEACEAFPFGYLASRMTSGEKSEVGLTRSLYSHPRLKDEDNSNDVSPYLAWHHLIQAYTKTSLSFPSDKLIAISGLAKLFRDWTSGDEYLAGLWRRYLEGELLWVNHSPQYFGAKATTKRPAKYRAPSWSWASVDGSLTPGEPVKGQDRGFVIRVEDVHLDYLTRDKMGEVTGGWLRLRGRLLETALLVRHSSTDGTARWMVWLEGVGLFDEEVPPAPACLNLRVCLDVVQENFTRENEDGLLFSMVAKTGESAGGHMYMLLFKLVDRQKGVFQRLGIILVAEDIKRRVLEVERGLDKPRLPCVELHEDGQHSIDAIKRGLLEVPLRGGLDKPTPCVELHEDGQHSIIVI